MSKMIRLRQIKLKVNEASIDLLLLKCRKKLKINESDIINYTIIKKSIDARLKPDIYYSYIIDIKVKDEKRVIEKHKKDKDIVYIDENTYKYKFTPSGKNILKNRPIIVGFGPCGLISAYMLASYGYKPLIIERGENIDKRTEDVLKFWHNNKLKKNSNVQFGEGGAGTFSDGKLNTRIKDKNNYQRKVFEIFVENGAPKEILYEQNPHIGTDILRKMVKNIRNKIIELGGEIRFNTCLTDIEIINNKLTSITINNKEKINCDLLLLAIGHSARDTFNMLYKNNINMESKPFAIGLRIIHPQELINQNQYGKNYNPKLKNASYKLTYKSKTGRGVYTFCMCPGGYVINASSEDNRLCINGMSNYKRDSGYANSAIIATIDKNDYGEGILAGLYYQQKIEEKAYLIGKSNIPVSSFKDYKNNTNTNQLVDKEAIKGNFTYTNINNIFKKDINDSIKEAIIYWDKLIPGFANDKAILLAPETRTSSPIRIIRDELGESNIKGIYPCGEGAGYAGGITSAAIDGLIAFERIANKYNNI